MKLAMNRHNRALVVALIAAGGMAAGSAGAQIWDCTDSNGRYLTNINPMKPHYLCVSRDDPKGWVVSPSFAPGCQYVERQAAGSCKVINPGSTSGSSRPTQAQAQPQPDPTAAFREQLKVGDQTALGLVIEVKRPIAKVQTSTSERWYRIDELQPAR